MFKLIICTFLIFKPLLSLAVDCQKEYQKHLETDLNLSYKEFDQTQNSGMRKLGNLGCHKETADLIERYIQINNSKENSLWWHVAQQRAMANDYFQAILNAKKVLLDDEDFSKQPLRWNDYVLATIAFWEGDKEKLIFHRNEVSKAKDEYIGNKINLKLLDALIENFGKSYNYAASKL